MQEADLQGREVAEVADLTDAQLQGADLARGLADSELNETFVFRANIADAYTATTAVGPFMLTK